MITRNELYAKLDWYRMLYGEYTETLLSIDPDLQSYAYRNLFEPDKHGIYEILGVCRFLTFFSKYNFSVSAYRKYITFAEQLKIKSEKGMRAFKLEPFQKFLMANIWGWKKDDGTRVTRDALLYVPRKASKTSLIAQIAIYDMLFGPPDSQCYIASNSFNQSKVCFDIITASVKTLDPKMKYFHRTREKIYSVIPGKESFIQCLSSSPDKLDGLNANVIVLDEFSQADSAELRNVLTSSQGTRENPLVVTITTASTKLESPFVNMLNTDKKILTGELENDNIFAVIFEAEEGDDIGDPNVWHRVQPMLGVSVKEAYYEAEHKKALMSAEDLVTFKTKLLNQFCQPVTTQWISPGTISRNLINLKISDITTRPMTMVSYDLSVSNDMSSVAYMMYDSINKSFACHIDYYLPAKTIETHYNKELYQHWVDQGYLKICGDETIDYEMIAKDIVANSKYLNILQIFYDAYKNRDVTNVLKAYGAKNLSAYRQVYSQFTAPTESMKTSLADNKMKFDNNPITVWEFGNVVLDEDSMGNIKPIKASANRKIDGIIVSLMCLGGFMNYKR